MDCEICYKKSNRLKGRRRCKGELQRSRYVKVQKKCQLVCDYFIPEDYLFTWNESLYVEQSMPTTKKRQSKSMPTFLGKQPPARASHPAKEGRGG